MNDPIPFWKMHGAANDFLLVDDRARTFPAQRNDWIEHLCSRRTGVGSDGLILIQPGPPDTHFRMRFFNPDGGEAEMCGNGARCVARLAADLGIAPPDMTFATVAGPIRAELLADQRIRLHMTPPTDWRLNHSLCIDDHPRLIVHVVNTGVPHAVVALEEIDQAPVKTLGAAIRYHADFAPAGVNVNLVEASDPRRLRVRTYERGVEDETLACGTGLTACGLVALRLGWTHHNPVSLQARSGHTLEVAARMADDHAEEVTLTGPAEHVYQGTLSPPATG